MQHVELDGLRITYRRAGRGQPLVLLHGGPNHSGEWLRQLETLSDEFDVVAWDMPGAGGSDDPPETFGIGGYAECLAAFIDVLGVRRPHVVGLSFGTTVALELYRLRPELPQSLVLVSAFAGWAGSLPPEVVRERLEALRRQSEEDPEEVVAQWLPMLFSSTASPEALEHSAAIIRDFHPVGLRAIAAAMAEADLRDVLSAIAVPTLLLYGDADVRSPPPVAESLHAAIPGSRLVWVPGVGHHVNLEAPDRFDDEIRSFLRLIK